MIKPVIAIDGPAASGKGTLSRNLASALNFAHMDTGALYRAVGYEVLKSGGSPDHEEDALRAVATLEAKLKQSDALSNPDLRQDAVGVAASKVAVIQSVRDALVTLQRTFANHPPAPCVGAILDGRDIGTIICPDAPLKLFVSANEAVRAKRRTKELQSKGLDVTYKAVLEDMRARDARDMTRKVAPLRPAEDSIVIDSSDLNEAELLENALEYAKKAFVISSQ